MNHLILVTLKEMKQLQSNIKLNELEKIIISVAY